MTRIRVLLIITACLALAGCGQVFGCSSKGPGLPFCVGVI